MTGAIELDTVYLEINRKKKEIRIKGKVGRRVLTLQHDFGADYRTAALTLQKVISNGYRVTADRWD